MMMAKEEFLKKKTNKTVKTMQCLSIEEQLFVITTDSLRFRQFQIVVVSFLCIFANSVILPRCLLIFADMRQYVQP